MRERLSNNVNDSLLRLWRRFDAPYDHALVDEFAESAASTVLGGSQSTGDLSSAYLSQVLEFVLGRNVQTRNVRITDTLRGPALKDVYRRPVEFYRYLRSEGVEHGPSRVRAEQRLIVMADEDLSLASRISARDTLEPVTEVTGYRRIVHPELSVSGVCGLCIVAADRVYSKEVLLPIHARCRCTVLPVTDELDPGRELNDEELSDIYRRAGGNDAKLLKRVRIRNHGELGPVLTEPDHHFRDSQEVQLSRNG